MSLVVARKRRAALYFSIAGLLVMAAAVSAVSARDPSGVTVRIGMVMILVGAALLLPWRWVVPTVLGAWLGPNVVRSLLEDWSLFNTNMWLELPGLIGIGVCTSIARDFLHSLEDEDMLIGATSENMLGVDDETGVYEERLLRPALESELVRSRRFNREFALVLVGIDELRQRFDYRDDGSWEASFLATARLLRSTRTHIDRAYRYGVSSFALILPESGSDEVLGLIRRLRRVARKASPSEGKPGGPLPTHFGATFFPHCAGTPDDLLRRAEVALRIADKNSNRIQLDGAEAPDLPSPETLRHNEAEASAPVAAIEPEVAAAPETLIAAELTAELPEAELPRTEVAAELSGADAIEASRSPSEAPAEDEADAGAIEPAEPAAPVPDPVRGWPVAVLNGTRVATSANEETGDETTHPAVVTPITALPALPADVPLDDAMSELMKHLDETLGMIRTLRSGTTPEREPEQAEERLSA